MAAQELNKTDIAIIDMLRANTGMHMLDSGGAYGRHWQRNATRDMAGEESGKLSAHSYTDRDGEVQWYTEMTVPLYHFLRNRVEYLDVMTTEFWDWADKNAEELSYFEEIEAWLSSEMIQDENNPEAMRPVEWNVEHVVNTYNTQNLLDQDMQFYIVKSYDLSEKYGTNDEYLIFIMSHNGCDARGGYSRARIFQAAGYNDYYSLYDFERGTIYCEDGSHYWDTYDGGHSFEYVDDEDFLNHNGTDTDLKPVFKEGDTNCYCQFCGGKLGFDGASA